ncbi:MAG: hypothetical protein HY719_01870 [Planctomycetes bacterium]|nr:hypothetical protein [Planctomycetota bacterium]
MKNERRRKQADNRARHGSTPAAGARAKAISGRGGAGGSRPGRTSPPVAVAAPAPAPKVARRPVLVLFDRDYRHAVLNIGHRGASGHAPENTVAAFGLATRMGAPMIELDVQVSRDGHVVVIHDAALERTTTGHGRVADHTLEELKALDAGGWFSARFAGEPIPTLREVLVWARGRVALNIEIKTEAVHPTREYGGVESKVVGLLRRCGMRAHVLVSSFNHVAVRRVRRLDGAIPVAVLHVGENDPRPLQEIVAAAPADQFCCALSELTPSLAEKARRWRVPVNVYTVNEPDEMRRAIALGVSGIFTNYPDRLAQVLQRSRTG